MNLKSIIASAVLFSLTLAASAVSAGQPDFNGTYTVRNKPKERLTLIDDGRGGLRGTMYTTSAGQKVEIPVQGFYVQSKQVAQGDWFMTVSGKAIVNDRVTVQCIVGYVDNIFTRIFTSVSWAQASDVNGGKGTNCASVWVYER